MKILVIQKKRIGDVLISTIIFEALKQKYPDAVLHYLVYEESFAVVDNNPFIDKIVILTDSERKKTFPFLKFLFKIRKEKYDVVIDAYGKPNSVIIGWFSGAKKTIAFSKSYTKLLYSDAIERTTNSFSEATTAIEHRMLLLEPMSIEFSIIRPKIYLRPKEIEVIQNKIATKIKEANKDLIMISALGSRDFKTYPLAYMAAIIDFIVKTTNVKLLLNYTPNQQNEAHELFKLCKKESQNRILFDFYESDLRSFIALTSQCKALIGNEGGATNMAKALSIPTFTIFCPGIAKQGWNIFENGTTNVAVHLLDYMNDNETAEKSLSDLYLMFKPELFEHKLQSFLQLNCQ